MVFKQVTIVKFNAEEIVKRCLGRLFIVVEMVIIDPSARFKSTQKEKKAHFQTSYLQEETCHRCVWPTAFNKLL